MKHWKLKIANNLIIYLLGNVTGISDIVIRKNPEKLKKIEDHTLDCVVGIEDINSKDIPKSSKSLDSNTLLSVLPVVIIVGIFANIWAFTVFIIASNSAVLWVFSCLIVRSQQVAVNISPSDCAV